MSPAELNDLGGYTRRARSTSEEMRALHQALIVIVKEIQPCTVRQVFYQAEIRELVEKTEQGYVRIKEALKQLRMSGEVPWESIADGTRWVRKPATWNNLSEAMGSWQKHYRRTLWANTEIIPEIWLEKDALAGVVVPVTEEWDVGLYVTRGYASLSYLRNAADSICWRRREGQGTAIYHLGDHDPSGRDAARAIQGTLADFCRELRDDHLAAPLPFTFEELAVTPEQIRALRLPTRPTKKTDSRAAKFSKKFGKHGGSVELDAIRPDTLRDLVRTSIEQHLPPEEMEQIRRIEAEEREGLARIAKSKRVRELG